MFYNCAIDLRQSIAWASRLEGLAMAEPPRKKTLEELRNGAIAELERRGYDVRGKTPAQIRKMLRARPYNHKKRAHRIKARSVNSGDKADFVIEF
jgi:hypothetical protein